MREKAPQRDELELRRPRRSWIVVSCLLLAGALLSGGVINRSMVKSWLRGEIDLFGNPYFAANHPDGTGDIAWREVHASLLPQWMMAQSRRPAAESPIRREEARALHAAQRAYARLRYSLGADRNLVELFDELDEHLRIDPVSNARRIDYLLWAYNDYLDRHSVPWRIEATMHVREDGRPAFYTRSYEVLTDLDANAGRLRLVRRVDLTNIDEGFLGHTTGRDEGALVMMSQTLQFGVRNVWPLLHAALDERLPEELQTVAPLVRGEARQHIPAGHLQLLQTTAVDELALIEVANSIHARTECGSSFRVYGLPWNGLAPPDQRALVDALGRSQNRDCPEVTLSEAARLLGASQRLGEAKDLHDSVEYLTTWVAGAVSAHELRHAADKSEGVVDCSGCPEGMDQEAQDELSAYLASFSVEGYGYAALAQACSMETAIAGSSSPHAQALALALPDLLEGGCRGPIPTDLYEQAAALEVEYFGARERVQLPEAYPRQVRLLRR